MLSHVIANAIACYRMLPRVIANESMLILLISRYRGRGGYRP